MVTSDQTLEIYLLEYANDFNRRSNNDNEINPATRWEVTSVLHALAFCSMFVGLFRRHFFDIKFPGDDIKLNHEIMAWTGVDWIQLAQGGMHDSERSGFF